MPRKYTIAKLMRGRRQQNAKKLCKTNKINIKEQNFMLHIEKLLKSSRNKKAFHQRALKSLNNFKESAATYEMALKFDNLYVEDGKSISAKDLKIKGLKELNLIHLDLLQQQAEQLNERDKRIRILEEENKNLKSRLDRIDRRVSLTINKKLSNIEPLTVDTFLAEEQIQLVDCETQTAPKLPTIKNIVIKSPVKTHALSDKLSQENKPDSQKSEESSNILSLSNSQTLRTSPREKKNKKDYPLLNLTSEILVTDGFSRVLSDKKPLIADTKAVLYKKPKLSPTVEVTPDIIKKDITDHSLRSRDKQKDFSFRESTSDTVGDHKSITDGLEGNVANLSVLIHTEEQTTSEQAFQSKDSTLPTSLKNSILTTDSAYFLSTPHQSFVDLSSGESSQLEIPKWRVKNLFPLYVMEGTENLGEDIFSKRHSKPEHDERRRKRWDLQRMREQRQYEKLRERYDSRHSSPGVRPGSNLSLWPSSDALLSVSVDYELPVCAFGQPLAVINKDSFFVPWLIKSNQITPKKKHR